MSFRHNLSNLRTVLLAPFVALLRYTNKVIHNEPSAVKRRTVLVLSLLVLLPAAFVSLVFLLLAAAWDGIRDEWDYRDVRSLPGDIRARWLGYGIPKRDTTRRLIAPTLFK